MSVSQNRSSSTGRLPGSEMQDMEAVSKNAHGRPLVSKGEKDESLSQKKKRKLKSAEMAFPNSMKRNPYTNHYTLELSKFLELK